MSLTKNARHLLDELGEAPKMGEIKKLAKTVKVDHALACELWSSGHYFARLLAALLFDKKQLDEPCLRSLAKDFETHDDAQRRQLSDWLLANQLMKDKTLTALAQTWQYAEIAQLRHWFWYHQARLRWTGNAMPEGSNEALLDALESDLADEVPDVQWTMNFCAGWIGVFAPQLRTRCVQLGERVGLYKHQKVPKNCTPNYLPAFIRIEVAKRE